MYTNGEEYKIICGPNKETLKRKHKHIDDDYRESRAQFGFYRKTVSNENAQFAEIVSIEELKKVKRPGHKLDLSGVCTIGLLQYGFRAFYDTETMDGTITFTEL